MGREIRAEVKEKNSATEKQGEKPLKRCNCEVMTGWWNGISREEGSAHVLLSLNCRAIRIKPKEPFCRELCHELHSCNKGERLK